MADSMMNERLLKLRAIMSLDSLPNNDPLVRCWEELGMGAATVSALAVLASRALADATEPAAPRDLPPEGSLPKAACRKATATPELSPQARAILVASLPRGLLEIKAVNTAFETPDRLLAVHVEIEPERWRVFRDRRDPRYTIGCLDGFRQLCAAGLVIHHLYREFSLSSQGFRLADQLVVDDETRAILDRTVELG